MKKYIYLLSFIVFAINTTSAMDVTVDIPYGKSLRTTLTTYINEQEKYAYSIGNMEMAKYWHYFVENQGLQTFKIKGWLDLFRDGSYLRDTLKIACTLDLSEVVVAPKKYLYFPEFSLKGFLCSKIILPKVIDSIIISPNTFEGNFLLEKVENSIKITKISRCAFKDCTKLNFVIDGNMRIEDGAFAGVNKVSVEGGYNYYESSYYSSDGKYLIYRRTKTKSGDELIYCSPNVSGTVQILTGLNLGGVNIREYAFYRCNKLSTIILGNEFTKTTDTIYNIGTTYDYRGISYTPFNGLPLNKTHWDSCTAKIAFPKNKKIVFPMGNFSFTIGEAGELYGKRLIYVPSGLTGTAVINKSLGFDKDIFKNVDCSKIDSLHIASGQIFAAKGVFDLSNFTSLKSLYLDEIHAILPNFINCPNLTSIYCYAPKLVPNSHFNDCILNGDIDILFKDLPYNNISNITLYVWDTLNSVKIKESGKFDDFKDVIPINDSKKTISHISKKILNNVEVYPTLATSYITLKTDQTSLIYIYNVYGVLIDLIKVNGEKTIDISSWINGIYYFNNTKIIKI